MHSQNRRRKRLLLFALFFIFVGILLFVTAKAAVDHTNTLEFCISCHEMKSNNYNEYKDTVHAKNRTGVKATCSVCHVPHDFLGTVVRKLEASNDLYKHFTGAIDTPEKFEAHRLELAKRVWHHMKSTNSQECRGCHDVATMDPEQQGKTAQKQHQKLLSGDKTCIDCHFGIAHKEPAGGHSPDEFETSAH